SARVPVRYTGMTAVDVASSQRARLLAAMANVVAAKGYAATTVADVVSAAGVSRSTFYELFASKEACFLDAYNQGVEDLLRAGGDVRELEDVFCTCAEAVLTHHQED